MKRQIIAVICAASLLAGLLSLASCGGKKPELSRVTNVYKSTDIVIEENLSISKMLPTDDGVVALGYIYSERDSQPVMLTLDAQSGQYTTENITLPKNTYITEFSAAPDGGMFLLSSSYDEKTEKSGYEIYSVKDGKCELCHEDIASLFGDSVNEDMFGYFYISGFAVDGEGNFFISSETSIVVLDKSMKMLYELEVSGNIDALATDSEGRVFAKYRDESWRMNVAYLDNKKRDFGEKLTLPEGNEFLNSEVYIGPGYDFYLDTDTALYGHNSGDAAPTELCNWVNSDIIHNGVDQIVIIDEKTMVVYYYEYNFKTETSTNELYLMKHIPDEEVPERYIIDLAVYGTPYQLTEMAVRYNRSSDKYRVRITDWSQYATDEDYLAGEAKLENEMLSGNSPDMIAYSRFQKANSWAKNNSFADLYSLMKDKDSKIKREDFFDGLLGQLERGGKLYELPSTLSMQTLIGKRSNLPGERWSVSELTSFASGLASDQWLMSYMRSTSVLNTFLSCSLDSFIDYDSALCSFDTPEFKALLEFAKKCGEKGNIRDKLSGDELADYEQDRNSVFRKDIVLLSDAYISDVATFLADKYSFGGEDVTAIGYPCESGSGATLQINDSYAIFRSSPVKEGAWEFICSTFDNSNRGYMHSIPAVESIFMEMSADELERQYYFFADGGWSSWEDNEENKEMLEIYDGSDGMYARVTQADIDGVAEMVRGAKLVGRGLDNDVFSLISEEAQIYFEGSKSVDETVKVIQDRVSMLVAENS